MSSRRPVNKVSPRLRPSGGASTPDAAPSGERTTARTRKIQRPTPRLRGSSGSAPSEASSRPDATESPRRRRFGFGRTSAPDADRTVVTSRPSPRAGTRSLRRLLPSSGGVVAGLLVAAVVLSAFAAVAFFRPGVADGNQAYVATGATQEVSAAADHALKTVYSYDAKNIDGYKDAVHQVVTGGMLTDFDKFADTTISAVKQAQSTAQATADPIGVTSLTDDRAELLVNLTVSSTKDNVPQQSASGPIVLHMEKINGRWLASEIADR